MTDEKTKPISEEEGRRRWKEGIEELERRAKDPNDTNPAVVAYRELLASRSRR